MLAPTDLPLADNWNMHDGWGWGWMVPMMLMMVLFWGAIILGVVWLVREGVRRRHPGTEETALAILDRRFAEGTLSTDDYRQRRSVLVGAKVRDPEEDAGSPAIQGT